MCLGCGACFSVCSDGNIQLNNILTEGLRPRVDERNCKKCGECLQVCPGLGISHELMTGNVRGKENVFGLSRGILEVWEGYATDPEIRFRGSSGGLVSALAIYCLEREGLNQIIHIASDENQFWRNKTVVSVTRDEILRRTGSRYSPASPCDGLREIKNYFGQSVFIGKPCDVEGLRKMQGILKEVERKIDLAIGIFCAGTPSVQGTLDLLKKMKIDSNRVEKLRYRGKGWPGMFSVSSKGNKRSAEEIPYSEAWGFLQKYRPFRCYLCPDGTSEFADISCGDPWYKKIEHDELGSSLVIARTEKGMKIIQKAVEHKYVSLKKVPLEVIEQSQKNLLEKRQAIWGRLLALRMFGVPIPIYSGFNLYESWKDVPFKEKMRSFFGTARRIIQRKYYYPSS
jgi:coenzyme F420 hydrogenase subunit beta